MSWTKDPNFSGVKTDNSVYIQTVAIKDRLYRDMVHLEALLGDSAAAMNIQQIVMEVGLNLPNGESK